MKLEDQKIINLEKEVFKKFGEALDLMKKRSDMRLQLANQDGMPDEWEMINGLDPKSLDDSRGFDLDKKYSNVEVYLNSLIK